MEMEPSDPNVSQYTNLRAMLEAMGVTEDDVRRLMRDDSFLREVASLIRQKVAEYGDRTPARLSAALHGPSSRWPDEERYHGTKTGLIHALQSRLQLPSDADISVLADYTEDELLYVRGIGEAGVSHIIEVMLRHGSRPKPE